MTAHELMDRHNVPPLERPGELDYRTGIVHALVVATDLLHEMGQLRAAEHFAAITAEANRIRCDPAEHDRIADELTAWARSHWRRR